MPKQIIIAEQHRIAAVFSEDQIQELIVAKGSHQVSDIYLGVVENVLPGIDAAFVNIGDSERNGFIHVTDLGPLRLKRSAASITELLAPQQKVLVQIMKEPTGNKGPRLTGNITLPGRYLVLMPFGRGVNLSRRIRKEEERSRLRALAILVKPAGMGLLVRTEAEGVAEEAIIEDLEFLQRQWESIQQEALSTRPPSLLNRDDDFVQRVLRDVYSAGVNRIVADSHTGVKRIKQHLANWNGGRSPQGVLIDQHRERVPILEYFRVNAAIREALKPRVDLPSGGYIIIEPTEALTVIDVNSGSFTRSATARETVLWTNCEAATEIARQLRLRNVAGVIIVDFIDMDSRRDQLQVLEHFNKALRADKARPQIAQLSELGLVELTRKRQGQNIYELFGQTCPSCGGLGHIAHLPGEEPQVVDPLAVPRELPAEPRPVTMRESTRESIAQPNDDLELDSAQDPQALELMHHPSYQERSAGGHRGSRRRRRRETSPPGRGGKESSVAPSFTNRDRDKDRDRDRDRETVDEREPREAAQSSRSRSERNGRSRNGRRDRNSGVEPEVIVVEMTPEEQEVYALLGISPLVLTDRTPTDAKSAVISVVLPGEAPVTDGQSAAANVQHSAESVNDAATDGDSASPHLADRDERDEEVSGSSTGSKLPTLKTKNADVAVDSAIADEPDLDSSEGEQSEETESSSSSPSRTRRRRRRSSAAEAAASSEG